MIIKDAKFVKGIKGTDEILEDGLKKLAFVGRSNVGKSSLINSLIQRKNLAKSSSSPGKTREVNFYLINSDVYFVDLPGYGYAKMKAKTQEKLGKLLMWFITEQQYKPEQVIIVIDSRTGPSEQDEMMIQMLSDYVYDFVVVLNKTDKLNQSDLAKITKEFEGRGLNYVLYSTKKHTGREELLGKLNI